MRKIGELMRVGDFILMVKESKSCDGCFFQSERFGCICARLGIANYRKEAGECRSGKREDGKSIIFEETNKLQL